MAQDLAALAPPAIVCVAFLIAVGMLLRRELAPKRFAKPKDEASEGGPETGEQRQRSES